MSESQNHYSAAEQVSPKANSHPACWQVVINDVHRHDDTPVRAALLQDMKDRDEWGRSKYGVPLQPFNGRDALIDLYQEFLDATVYTKQWQLENPNSVELNATYSVLLDDLYIIRMMILERDSK